MMCSYFLRVLCVLWAQGQVDEVDQDLLVQWVPTTPTHTTLATLGLLDHPSELLHLLVKRKLVV